MNMFDDDSNFIYILRMMGQKVKINGKEEQVLISNYRDRKIDYKKIKAIVPFHTGDLIEYQGSNWLIIGEVSKTNTIYKATMQKANRTVKMYIDNTLRELPSIIETSTQTINTGNTISIVEGNIKVTIQDNSITNKIDYLDQFIKMGAKWQVNGFTSELVGVKYLYCSKISFSEEDDKENEIADRWLHEIKHSYVFSVEPKTLTLNESETKQITVSVIDNNVNVVNPTIAYVSSNINVATVDANGLITGITEGTAILTVSFIGQDIKTYSEIINVVVEKVPIIPPVIIPTYDLSCSNTTWIIKKTSTVIFTAHKYLGSNEVTAEFDFELNLNGLTTTQVTVTETTSSYIKIKNASVDTTTPAKTIWVRFREKGTTDWILKEITLKGIYG
jgi:hypothetical protein